MRRTLLRTLVLLLCVAAAATAWGWRVYEATLHAPLALGEPMRYTLEPGSSLRAVTRDLAGAGVFERRWPLLVYARLNALDAKIRAGEYQIEPGMTPLDVLALLIAGRVVQHQLTLIEGWTFRQALSAIQAHPRVVATLDGPGDWPRLMESLGAPGVHPEGRFLAETYHFPSGTRDVEVLRQAYRAMVTLLAREWAGRAAGLPYGDPAEALVMASIIEKETGVPEERPVIAGVFVRRLARGMRLETDPTVIYGLGERFDGNLRRRDLRADTPYNTYVHNGLPPTPIALPGAAALHAALHPSPGDALYFVSRGDGTHQFSRTYAQHREAVMKYQIRRRKVGTGG